MVTAYSIVSCKKECKWGQPPIGCKYNRIYPHPRPPSLKHQIPQVVAWVVVPSNLLDRHRFPGCCNYLVPSSTILKILPPSVESSARILPPASSPFPVFKVLQAQITLLNISLHVYSTVPRLLLSFYQWCSRGCQPSC